MAFPGGLHVPERQVLGEPQGVPSARLPVSAQTGRPLAQEMAATLHGFDGVQLEPAAQEPQAPPWQTRSVPQEAPSVSGWPVSAQVEVEPEQLVRPEWQGLAGVQRRFGAQPAMQRPALQTLPLPQAVPSGTGPALTQTAPLGRQSSTPTSQ